MCLAFLEMASKERDVSGTTERILFTSTFPLANAGRRNEYKCTYLCRGFFCFMSLIQLSAVLFGSHATLVAINFSVAY